MYVLYTYVSQCHSITIYICITVSQYHYIHMYHSVTVSLYAYVSQCHSITIYICMPAVEHNNVSLLYINVCTYNIIVIAMVRYKMYYNLTYESHNIVLCIVCIMSI